MMLSGYEKIKNIAQTICEKQGCVLYDVEFQSGSKGQGRKLLVYVDKKSGVSLDDCEKVSREVSDVLDQDSSILDGEYILEVSSPGLERPLREKWHFEAVIGSKVFVQSLISLVPDTEPVPRYKVTGVLKSVEGDSICVLVDGKSFMISIKDIKKSNVIFNYDSIRESKD